MITATVRYKHSQIFAKYQRFQFVNIFSISDRLAIFFFFKHLRVVSLYDEANVVSFRVTGT